MRQPAHDTSIAIFLAVLLGTFVVSYLGRRHARELQAGPLSGQRLNKWLVGLSAGATANSGFVVTGAVGLGYSAGAQGLLLPLAWLLGDITFWSVFPGRINRTGTASNARALTDVIVHQLGATATRMLRFLIGTLVLLCLGGYVSAQWLAGQKFLHGAFGFGNFLALVIFAALIIVYTAIGGFRGSVYADSFQAIIRLVGTSVALISVVWFASSTKATFWDNVHAAGPAFTQVLPAGPIYLAFASIFGFAAAAFGFGLGQPQMVTRYMAGASPTETRAAWWIYLTFVHFTWLAMTTFGIVLRGVLPNIEDPEAGLSTFFSTSMGPVLTGLIVADIFATIAATSNSLLVAMAQTVRFDLLASNDGKSVSNPKLWPASALLGALTMLVSMNINQTVLGLALSSVSLMGAGVAPAVMIRVLHWRHSGISLVFTVLAGVAGALVWKTIGLSQYMNEAAPGMLAGLVANWICVATARLNR